MFWELNYFFNCHCEEQSDKAIPTRLRMPKNYCVYIITNSRNTVLYTGVTGNLLERINQHKNKLVFSFSSKYNLNKLVYFEVYDDINLAIKREKQIKAGNRKKKFELITKLNPLWKDLYHSLC